MQEIGVTSATVEMKNVSDNLSVPGNVDIDEERLSYVQTRVSGWIQDVSANATYQYVRKGQRLFTVYSPDLVSSEQEYLLARQNKSAFSQDAHGMGTQEDGWLLKAAEERLQQFGVPAQTIADLDQTGKVQRNIAVDSPASGYIIERNALPNAYVQPDTKLYTIADLSTVWVYANVFQNDVGKLRPGDQAQVTVDAYPGRHFNGRIDQILPQVDLTTRTVRVRLVFSNPGVMLKPGMYVNVAIAVTLGRQMVIRLPRFCRRARGPSHLSIMETAISNRARLKPARRSTIRSSSSAGSSRERKSSARPIFWLTPRLSFRRLPGRLRPSRHNRQPAPRLPRAHQIDFSTEPSPPRKGANTLHVKLTGPDGKPVTGAQVTVTFFMPAMPAMGMAAEHATAALADKGNGLYEGASATPVRRHMAGDRSCSARRPDSGYKAAHPQRHGRHVMISRIIAWCARNPFLVFTGAILLVVAGVWCMQRVPLDALPDISDVQVIIHTSWPGEPPNVIEDQVTYPIVTALLAAPHVKNVRAQTMFGDSYVFVVFQDGTDLYWARSRVTEYLQQIAGQAARRRASRHRSGRHRRGLGIRVRHRGPHVTPTAWPICARCRTGICAISSKPCPAWRRWPASAASCASTR